MDARKLVEEDLKKCIAKALRLKVLSNPRISGDFFSNRQQITSKYTFFTCEHDYLEKYSKSYEQGEFLATLNDGAFLQINYEFVLPRKNTSYLAKMNLCYLPPVEADEIKNEYIRIDYDNSSSSFFHASAHVHFGFRNTMRIPINEVLLFSEFLQLVLYLFYPDSFRLLFENGTRMTTTRNTLPEKLTKERVLLDELEDFYYLRVTNTNMT